jgi:hypothetical protein
MEYEKQLLALDNRIKAIDEEKKGSWNTMGHFTTTPVASSFTPGGLAPMDLITTQWQYQNNNPCPRTNFHHKLVNSNKRTTPAEKA